MWQWVGRLIRVESSKFVGESSPFRTLQSWLLWDYGIPIHFATQAKTCQLWEIITLHQSEFFVGSLCAGISRYFNAFWHDFKMIFFALKFKCWKKGDICILFRFSCWFQCRYPLCHIFFVRREIARTWTQFFGLFWTFFLRFFTFFRS